MTTLVNKGLSNEFLRSCRYGFEAYYCHWHEYDNQDLQTWNERNAFYANLTCNNEFRAYCYGRFHEQSKNKESQK